MEADLVKVKVDAGALLGHVLEVTRSWVQHAIAS